MYVKAMEDPQTLTTYELKWFYSLHRYPKKLIDKMILQFT